MVLDQFRFSTDQEIEKQISSWWEDLEYFRKLKVLLLAYPDLGGICKIEKSGIGKLWKEIPLSRKKELYEDAWKY